MIWLPEPDSKCSVVCGPGLLVIIDLNSWFKQSSWWNNGLLSACLVVWLPSMTMPVSTDHSYFEIFCKMNMKSFVLPDYIQIEWKSPIWWHNCLFSLRSFFFKFSTSFKKVKNIQFGLELQMTLLQNQISTKILTDLRWTRQQKKGQWDKVWFGDIFWMLSPRQRESFNKIL